MKHHDLIDAIDELGAEMVFHLRHHGELHQLRRVVHHRLNFGTAEIAGHDDHGVFEVHRAALAIGHTAIVKHLQQHVEYVRMRLFYLVKQQHAIGLAAHLLGELPTLVEAHIAGRRADQASHRMLLHVFAHVDTNQSGVTVKQKLRKRLGQLRFSDPGWAEKQERTVRLVRVSEARP